MGYSIIDSQDYPKIDGHRKHYVRYPLQLPSGKWVAVDVLATGGYIKPGPKNKEFDTRAECKTACDQHNFFHGWSHQDVIAVIAESMKNKYFTKNNNQKNEQKSSN